jgi:hypothetical protein
MPSLFCFGHFLGSHVFAQELTLGDDPSPYGLLCSLDNILFVGWDLANFLPGLSSN